MLWEVFVLRAELTSYGKSLCPMGRICVLQGAPASCTVSLLALRICVLLGDSVVRGEAVCSK